ncbi:hypothetical protein Tco_0671030 [Tanacetum coccineum]
MGAVAVSDDDDDDDGVMVMVLRVVVGSNFGLRRICPPENFSGGGARWPAVGEWWPDNLGKKRRREKVYNLINFSNGEDDEVAFFSKINVSTLLIIPKAWQLTRGYIIHTRTTILSALPSLLTAVLVLLAWDFSQSPKPVLLSLKHVQLPVLGSTRMYRDLRLPTSGPK